jgi:hypothetical protein
VSDHRHHDPNAPSVVHTTPPDEDRFALPSIPARSGACWNGARWPSQLPAALFIDRAGQPVARIATTTATAPLKSP